MRRFDQFVRQLSKLDSNCWKATLKEEPEWKWMRPISKAWDFGPFVTTFIVLGLNDYQTKGASDVGYWPKIVPLLPQHRNPQSPDALLTILEPFYARDRMRLRKVTRLHRFVQSELCAELWTTKPRILAADLPEFWNRLGQTMGQRPHEKTIALGAKFIALALLMVGNRSFDFEAIPVPVDSRVRKVSQRLGEEFCNDMSERQRWKSALNRIRARNPDVTMLHLDNLLWQIGAMSNAQIQAHLTKIKAGNIAMRISALFDPIMKFGRTKKWCDL